MGKKTTNSLLAFLTGAAAGALVGILFAPDTGANTRDKLSFKLDKYKKTLEDLIEDLISGKEISVSAAKSEGEKVVSDAKQRAERLLADVDELIGHIKTGDKGIEN
jgi:gas vesicle protein